jgi:hypothetical protein
MKMTHSKPLAARHGRGTAWTRHAMCESAFRQFVFILIFTGPLASEAFVEGDACDEAWIYVDPTGIDVPLKNTAFT